MHRHFDPSGMAHAPLCDRSSTHGAWLPSGWGSGNGRKRGNGRRRPRTRCGDGVRRYPWGSEVMVLYPEDAGVLSLARLPVRGVFVDWLQVVFPAHFPVCG